MRRYKLGFSHPTFGIVATGSRPIAVQDFERIDGACKPCLLPIAESASEATAPEPSGTNGHAESGNGSLGSPKSQSDITSLQRAALLSVPVPYGWIPTGPRCLPPAAVPHVSWRTAQSIVAQWNEAERRRSGGSARRWFVASHHSKGKKWSVIAVDILQHWRPVNAAQFPPLAVVMPEQQARYETRRLNEVELATGAIRTWAFVVQATNRDDSVGSVEESLADALALSAQPS
jgi:hypothetical protein